MKESWIWRVVPTGKRGMSDKEVEEWFDRCKFSPLPWRNVLLTSGKGDSIQWHRARVLVERWDEDVETIEEEFRRTIRSFLKMSETWLALTQHSEPSGHRAYALEKSAAYSHMAKESRTSFEMAGGSWPADRETLFDYICRLRIKRQRFVVIFLVSWLCLSSLLCRPFDDHDHNV